MEKGKPEEEEALLKEEKEREKGAEEQPNSQQPAQHNRAEHATQGRATSNSPPSYERPPPQPAPSHKPKEVASGFFNFLAKVAEEVSQEIGNGIEKLSETIDKEIHNRNIEGERHFQDEFRLPPSERLLGSYGCKVLNGDVGVSGTAYISTNNFCFQGGNLKILIPLQTILKIQKALRLREYDQQTHARQRTFLFQPVPPTARGDCIQLYTNDHMIHHFFSDPFAFGPLHNVVLTFESFYKLVDEAWKYANTPHEQEVGYFPQPDPKHFSQDASTRTPEQPPQQPQEQQQQPQQQQQQPPQQPQQQQQQPQQPQEWQPFPTHVAPVDPSWQVPAPAFLFPQQPVQMPPQQQQPQHIQPLPQQGMEKPKGPEDLEVLLSKLSTTSSPQQQEEHPKTEDL